MGMVGCGYGGSGYQMLEKRGLLEGVDAQWGLYNRELGVAAELAVCG